MFVDPFTETSFSEDNTPFLIFEPLLPCLGLHMGTQWGLCSIFATLSRNLKKPGANFLLQQPLFP